MRNQVAQDRGGEPSLKLIYFATGLKNNHMACYSSIINKANCKVSRSYLTTDMYKLLLKNCPSKNFADINTQKLLTGHFSREETKHITVCRSVLHPSLT